MYRFQLPVFKSQDVYKRQGDNNCKLTDKNGVTEQLPIMGFNYIERDFGSKDMYRPMHEKYPEKLCFGSEVNKDVYKRQNNNNAEINFNLKIKKAELWSPCLLYTSYN